MSRLVSLGIKKEENGPPNGPQDFLAFCSAKCVRLVFEELLAPRNLMIEGWDRCSHVVLKCIEKYYCWMGINDGYLELTRKPPATSASPPRNYFIILRPLSEHSDWQVFLTIVMTVTEVNKL